MLQLHWTQLIIRNKHCFLIGAVRAASYEVVSNGLSLLGWTAHKEISNDC